MNEKIKQLVDNASVEVWGTNHYNGSPEFEGYKLDSEMFAKLLIEDVLAMMRQEWYDLNNAPAVIVESPRDVGIRIGKKGEIITLMAKIKSRYEFDK